MALSCMNNEVHFEEPWRYALGPGGHYFDKCAPTISSSCFPNTRTPMKRIVYEHVVEVPQPCLYPAFCHDDHHGCSCSGHHVEVHHGCSCHGHRDYARYRCEGELGYTNSYGHRQSGHGCGHHSSANHCRCGGHEHHSEGARSSTRGYIEPHFDVHDVTTPLSTQPYEEWRKQTLSDVSLTELA